MFVFTPFQSLIIADWNDPTDSSWKFVLILIVEYRNLLSNEQISNTERLWEKTDVLGFVEDVLGFVFSPFSVEKQKMEGNNPLNRSYVGAVGCNKEVMKKQLKTEEVRID